MRTPSVLFRAFLLLMLLCSTAVYAQVYRGMPRADVIKSLGDPNSNLLRGNKEVLIYPQGRVELVDGLVTKAQGIPLESQEAIAQAVTLPTVQPTTTEVVPPTPTPASIPTPEPAATAEPVATSTPAVSSPAPSPPPAPAQTTLPAPAYDLEAVLEENESKAKDTFSWMAEFVFVALRMVFVMMALYPVFRFIEIDARWIAYPLVAFADTGCRELMYLVAYFAFQINDLYYVDESIATLVTAFTIHKATRCSAVEAFQAAFAAKVATVIVMLLVVSIMGSFMMKL
ncbi:MAG: hypothetical protein SFY80_14270 [Verrucomicrobiota bacterium]|nr:hypothetical protein [Verrucomicrobiota bacterium]